MSKKILKIETSTAKYGGNIYEHYFFNYIEKHYIFKRADPIPSIRGRLKYFGVLKWLMIKLLGYKFTLRVLSFKKKQSDKKNK
ncbi:MAG: hypothetical protein JW682_05585 [Campylobacterales bacterium]|nr:hypothetical protein [Campylobacterales bacterium]HEO98693.1 hypothetical protein [Campylobacterota bacterium]